jgi:hypothetical protein
MARQLTRTSNHYIDIASSELTSSGFTASIWVYPDSLPAVATPCGASGTGYWAIFSIGTALRIQIDNSTTTASLAESAGSTLTTGEWQHLCATVSASPNDLYAYRNGTQVASATGVSDAPPFTITVYAAGRYPGGGGTNYWDGKLADYALYDAVLSAAEIAALAKGASPLTIRPTKLVMYWPLWGITTPEVDLGPLHKVGTVSGAVLANHAPVGPPIPFVG